MTESTANTIVCSDCNSSEVLVELWDKKNAEPGELNGPHLAMGYEVKDGTPGRAFCLKCNDYITYNHQIVGGCFL